MENLKDEIHLQNLKRELESLDKNELIDRITRLEKHVEQLQNINKKLQGNSRKTHKRNPTQKPFNFSKTQKRHILLRFYYLGWDYQGYAEQEDSIETIEHHIINALVRTCLIKSRDTANYHRCGRTDKGVSAFHQVISLDIRSKLSEEQIRNGSDLEQEHNYCYLLNRVLPNEIRCIAWMPISNPFYSARFDCKQRTYRYFFPKGKLNIALMEKAAQQFVGEHDFRNFCKMDVNNGVRTFVRNILSVRIFELDKIESEYQMCYIEIHGQAFLWHQIRCMMTILLLIGEGLEDPKIIKELFDVNQNPCKPNYQMAHFIPLNLYNCEYREKTGEHSQKAETTVSDISDWIYNEFNLRSVIEMLQGQWCLTAIKSSMMQSMLNDLQDLYKQNFSEQDSISDIVSILREERRSKSYKPVMTLQKCQSLDERIVSVDSKKRKFSDV